MGLFSDSLINFVFSFQEPIFVIARGTFVDKFAFFVTGHRKLIVLIFLMSTLLSALLLPFLQINYDMKDYLPEDSESTIALELMNNEFSSSIPNARLMVDAETFAEAVELKEKIKNVVGVTSVTWLDDVTDITVPAELIDESLLSQYYKDGKAVFSLTIAVNQESEAVDALYALVADGALTGDAVNTAVLRGQLIREVLGAAAILVPLIIVLLLLTTSYWLAPFLVLASIGIVVLINVGSNAITGEVSFITQAVSPILQLAVSLDYAIFLLNSFERHRLTQPDTRLAMCAAIRDSFASVAASAITTLFGFVALVFMNFQIGSDLGLNLVKGVVLSYVAVVIFLPALTLSCIKLLDRSRHKRVLPEFKNLGKRLFKIRIPALVVLLLLVVPCFLGQSRTDFIYGNGEPDADSRYGIDTAAVNEMFGEQTTVVLLVPRGNPGAENRLVQELSTIENVSSIVSYQSTVGMIPQEFLDSSITSNFYSDNFARIIVYTSTSSEGDEAFAVVSAIRAAAGKYYDESYTCGQSANLYDIKNVVEDDTPVVNGIAIIFIAITLLLTFRSLTLPVVLLFVIESAIWINLAVPYFTDTPLVYLGYLVINTVQLGATIDYAILLTDGYRVNRKTMLKKDAVISTMTTNFVSILTSGLILSAAGFCLYFTSSMEVVSVLGLLLARGTLLSMTLVLLALPALLTIFDPLTERLTFKACFKRNTDKEAQFNEKN